MTEEPDNKDDSPTSTLDLLENLLKERAEIYADIDSQLIQELRVPGTGITTQQLRLVAKKKNAFGAELAYVDEFEVGGIAIFAPAGCFIKDNASGVQFHNIEPGFLEDFVGTMEVIEYSVPSIRLKCWQLARESDDQSVQDQLGWRREIRLPYLWKLLELQPEGQSGGRLLVNGEANIFYIRDLLNRLRTVHLYWHHDNLGWRIRVDAVKGPLVWQAARYVFSQ